MWRFFIDFSFFQLALVCKACRDSICVEREINIIRAVGLVIFLFLVDLFGLDAMNLISIY
jgi:hypothetical protein